MPESAKTEPNEEAQRSDKQRANAGLGVAAAQLSMINLGQSEWFHA